jgi:hypothetical protein
VHHGHIVAARSKPYSGNEHDSVSSLKPSILQPPVTDMTQQLIHVSPLRNCDWRHAPVQRHLPESGQIISQSDCRNGASVLRSRDSCHPTLTGDDKKSGIKLCRDAACPFNNCLSDWVKSMHESLRPRQEVISNSTKPTFA